MDVFGSIVVTAILAAIMVVAAVICGAIKSLWFRFRWYVLGWKPVIFNESVLNRTVKDYGQFVNKKLEELKLSEEEKRTQIQDVELMVQDVIICYARNFSRHR